MGEGEVQLIWMEWPWPQSPPQLEWLRAVLELS